MPLSRYRVLAALNEAHGVYVVLHRDSGKVYVKKELTVYNRAIYDRLLSHPVSQIPRLIELEESEGCLTVIEDYIHGETLEELLALNGPMPENQVISLVRQLCRILHQLHSAQPPIVHRDIKPSNLMLTPEGALFLLDLNAAKFYGGGQGQDTRLLGTVGYAAPEQFGFGGSGPETDLYAVGVLMNVLLTGHLPQEGLAAGRLGPVIERCTQLEPSARYRTAQALEEALAALEKPEPTGWRRYLPPGFRSGQPGPLLMALTGYPMVCYLALTLEVEGAGPGLVLAERLTVLVMLLAMVLFTGDYLGVQRRFPPCRSRRPALRLLGVALGDGLIFCAAILFLSLLSLMIP